MSGDCQQSAVIYKATVSSKDAEKFYIGATEQTFKKRYSKHKEAINKKNPKSAKSLSIYIWSLEELTIKQEVDRDVKVMKEIQSFM